MKTDLRVAALRTVLFQSKARRTVLFRLSAPCTAVVSHHGLDVMRGPVQGDGQQQLFGFRSRHACERPYFRVAELSARHRCRDPRQLLQRMRHPKLFARGAQIDATPPVQPVRTGLGRRVRPAIAAVELCDQYQPAMAGGVQVTGELSDLRFELGNRQRTLCTQSSSVHGNLRQTDFMYSIVSVLHTDAIARSRPYKRDTHICAITTRMHRDP
jgi:hypothetical protein